MIFKKRVSFAIKAIGIYWLLYLISSFETFAKFPKIP